MMRALHRRFTAKSGRSAQEAATSLLRHYHIEVNAGSGAGVKILNKLVPPSFRKSMGYAEQNLNARSTQPVSDKDPR